MAPPTRLRPHLNDLLQKNLELEHVVADLRHQLTQSSAKWADERKTLAVGCDTLMASFAKFRARLDVQPSDWADSEGEVEQNLDAGRQSEEAGEGGSGMFGTKRDQGSSTTGDPRERCRILVAELRAREEELEESRRKREAAEEELQRVQQLLDAQSKQLQAALTSSGADTCDKASPERTLDDTTAQANLSKAGPENTLEKLDLANQEVSRLKLLLQDWKKYGNEWKRDSQMARVRASELQRREDELGAQVKVAEENKTLQSAEIQRLASALADQTAAAEQQRAACQESVIRVHDLEAMITRLRAQLSPEQLASFDSEQNQAMPEPGPTKSPTPRTDTNINKRTDPILLKIPYRGVVRKPSTENNEPQTEQQNVAPSSSLPQVPATQSIRVSPAPQRSNSSLGFNPADFEVCIHTCSTFPCRNDSRSFLWSRKQPSLPRHVLSTKKHHLCSPGCPGYRLLNMPLADAMKEPRKAKCRPPTEAEITLAAEEASKLSRNQQRSENETTVEQTVESESSEDLNEPEEGSIREEEAQGGGEEQSPSISVFSRILGKRQRSRTTDELQRARKLRPRASVIAKP